MRRMKNDTVGVCTRTSFSATTSVSSASPVSSSSLRTSAESLARHDDAARQLRVGDAHARSAPGDGRRWRPCAAARHRPSPRRHPERLKRVSSVDTANIVLSIISRSVPDATRSCVPPPTPVPSGSSGKSFGSKLDDLEARAARHDLDPALRAAERSVISSAVDLARDLVELARVAAVTAPFFFVRAGSWQRTPDLHVGRRERQAAFGRLDQDVRQDRLRVPSLDDSLHQVEARTRSSRLTLTSISHLDELGPFPLRPQDSGTSLLRLDHKPVVVVGAVDYGGHACSEPRNP